MLVRTGAAALPSVRLAANLNALTRRTQTVEQAERAVRADDVAHHVSDPESVLGLDPWQAHGLDDALAALKAVATDGWFLGLPVPGHPGLLRGPVPLNRAALAAGEVVVAAAGGAALVPHRVGQAVQWRVYPAERPLAPVTTYDAERALSETILGAAALLSRLDVAAGRRPSEPEPTRLAPGYSPRQQAAAHRAARLLAVCDAALADDGGSISAFEADRRTQTLRQLRATAAEALIAAVSWPS